MEKECIICGAVFSKKKKESKKQWSSKKLCSKKCMGVSHSRLYLGRKLPESTIINMRGKIPHNKGVFTSESYGSVHLWLNKNFVKTNCEHCGSSRFVEFALKKGCLHKHERENYLCLCSSCHKRYDYTPERRRRLSEALKGREILWKDKISASLRGRILSNEHRKKISEHNKKFPRPRNSKTGRFGSL